MTSPPPAIRDPESIRRILVRANNWIGDVVMISPALKSLREAYPWARIEAVSLPGLAGCFAGHPWVDGVVVYDPKGRDRGPLGFLKMASELRRNRYDLAVLFQKAFGAALMARLAGVPRRVGFDTDRRKLLLTHAIPETDRLRRIHHVEYFLEVARAAGCAVDGLPRRVYFTLDQADRDFASHLLLRAGAARFALLAAFAPAASKAPRAWHAERFAALAGELVQRRNAGIVVVGGPADREAARPILEAAGVAGIDAVGSSTVRQMAALIERCGLFVGNDSGPMHVAAALDVPVLALFGPGTPSKTAPYMRAERYIALTNNVACSPCRQDFFRECEPSAANKPMCLETISIRQASAALDQLLGRVSVPGSPGATASSRADG